MKHQTRIRLVGMVGNLVEAFDMAICGLLSVYFSKYLTGGADKGLFIVFLTFCLGYLARPIGASLLGLLSDTYGRKITLAASILIMGLATTSIGLIPPKSSFGIASILILLILRIIQSFSCGAEYLNSSAYLVENAEDSEKGYSGSWAAFGAMSGLLIASIVAFAVSYFVTAYPEFEWFIWRLPFILALLGSSIGLYIRLFIPESFEYIVYYTDHPKPKFNCIMREAIQYLRTHQLKSLYVFLLSLLGVTTTFQIYIYAPTQAHLLGHFTDQQIFISNIVSLALMLSIFPIIGRLSDQISREKIVIAASIGFLCLSHAYFHSLSHGQYSNLILMQCLITVPAAAYYATVPAMLSEMFPLKLRCTVLSVLYSTAASLAAGLTPFLSFILLKRTDGSISPAVLIIWLVVFTLMVMWLRHVRSEKQKVVLG